MIYTRALIYLHVRWRPKNILHDCMLSFKFGWVGPNRLEISEKFGIARYGLGIEVTTHIYQQYGQKSDKDVLTISLLDIFIHSTDHKFQSFKGTAVVGFVAREPGGLVNNDGSIHWNKILDNGEKIVVVNAISNTELKRVLEVILSK